MLSKTLFVFVTLFVCSLTASDVLELTDDDFSTRVAETETTLVMFFAPWCGHCKRLKPEYAQASVLLRGADPAIALAQVDCTEGGKETCSKFEVSGYPTLKIFKAGKLAGDYNGPREAAGIVKYMKAQTGPASKELKSFDELQKYLQAQETTLIGFFEKDSALKSVFEKYADKHRDKERFGHTSASDALKKFGVTDGIILFRAPQYHNKFEDSQITFEGSSLSDLSTFVRANFHGLVGHRTRDTAQEFEKPYIIAYYSVDYVKNPKGTNYWRNRMLKVVKSYTGSFRFAISNKDEFQHEINEYGYDYTGDKPVVLARDARGLKFVMKDEFSIENFEKFVNELEGGKLEPYIKSEPVPETQGPVTVAVAKNFEDVIINNDKDVLIEFYAPWCGHCKKLSPIWDELGEKLADEDVVIAKLDATANDVPPEFDVRGFPTLFWLPKDSKSSPVRYEGGRELDNFISYIAKNAATELKGYNRAGKPKKTKTEL